MCEILPDGEQQPAPPKASQLGHHDIGKCFSFDWCKVEYNHDDTYIDCWARAVPPDYPKQDLLVMHMPLGSSGRCATEDG